METARTLERKLYWPRRVIQHFAGQLRAHFAKAWVTGLEGIAEQLLNDPKDRHVLAVAIHARAGFLVIFNLREFKAEQLNPWGVTALHRESLLLRLHRSEPDLVRRKLEPQAADRKRPLERLLAALDASVPEFVKAVRG